jgi:DNA recombination protein RmuC
MTAWLAAFLGMALGATGAALWMVLRRGAAQAELANAKARAELLDGQLRERGAEIEQIRCDLAEGSRAREHAERQTAVLQEQLAARQKQFEEQQRLLVDAEKRLADTFVSIGCKALASNNEQFIALAKKTFETLMVEAKGDVDKKQQAIDALVKPIRELLEKQNTAVADIEKKREVAYKGLEEQIKGIAASHTDLRNETGRLVTALRRPEQRGRWGEMQLRNVVELAGMTNHCDFDEQVTVWTGEQSQRPDMIVNLPGGGVIVVDSKVALDAYLDGIQPGAERDGHLKRHASQVEDHCRKLAQKKYWDQFSRAPKLVVMFMPLESALVAALEIKPELHANVMQQHVLIATPTLLVALLRAVAYGWQQEDVAANARDIADIGRDLYERIAKFVESYEKVGKALTTATTAYNASIGTLESRVLSSARKLKDRGATMEPDIETPSPLEIETRPVVSQELRSLPNGS